MISRPDGSAAKRHDLPAATCPFRAIASPCPHRHSLAEPTPAPNSAMGRDPLSFQARKSSSRISKLKRWITLLFRMLALAALAFMIARPMTGGDSFSLSRPEAPKYWCSCSIVRQAWKRGPKRILKPKGQKPSMPFRPSPSHGRKAGWS